MDALLLSRPLPLSSAFQKTKKNLVVRNTATPETDVSRRSLMVATPIFGILSSSEIPALAQKLPDSDPDEFKICKSDCESTLEELPLMTTASGLSYRDLVTGTGPSPPIGFQVAANYVAMVPNGKVFDSSLEKKVPYIFRVGAGQVIAGLDEGIQTMKVGGIRRLYIPGPLAFPKGLSSAPGRPRVLPSSPVVFDVSLEFIPGLEEDEEE